MLWVVAARDLPLHGRSFDGTTKARPTFMRSSVVVRMRLKLSDRRTGLVLVHLQAVAGGLLLVLALVAVAVAVVNPD